MGYESLYKIEEAPDLPHQLGRHVAHDEASRNFPVRALFSDPAPDIKDVRHKRSVLIYDQGQLGSCTLNAALGCVSTRPFTRHFRSQKIIKKYYSETTKIDPYDGSWPPDDTGSDGNSAAKTLRNHNLISEWRHCFGINDVLIALQTTPVITGTNWYADMFHPAGNGLVKPGGGVAGGHEWCLIGIDTTNAQLIAANSWGTRWGDRGYFRISYDDYDRLLHEDGDATVFTS